MNIVLKIQLNKIALLTYVPTIMANHRLFAQAAQKEWNPIDAIIALVRFHKANGLSQCVFILLKGQVPRHLFHWSRHGTIYFFLYFLVVF